MKNPKLTIELVPSSLWKLNLREFLTSKSWDTIRKECYLKANNRCEICNSQGIYGKGHPVECHEIWEYNDETFTQKLNGVISLCPICHRVKHFGLSSLRGYTSQCKEQLKKINDWSPSELSSYLNKEFLLYNKRNSHEWDIDLSWLRTIKEKVQFKKKYQYLESLLN